MVVVTLHERDSSAEPPGAAWVARTGTMIAQSLNVGPPPHLVVPPSDVDSYRMAQAVTALARFGELEDRDWDEFDQRVSSSLKSELADGYAGPFSLGAQLVTASQAAGRSYSRDVDASLRGLAQRGADDDIYDLAAAALVQQWAAQEGEPVAGALPARDVRRAVATVGCRGSEALFLQATLVRVEVTDTGCDQAQRDSMVDDEIATLRSVPTKEPLSGDTALLLRATGAVARTPVQAAAVSGLKSTFLARLARGDVVDPLTVTFALSETPGEGHISTELAAYLRSVLAMGGPPVVQRLSPSAAAAVARTLDLAGRKVPAGLLVDSADLPTEPRARVLLALGATSAEAESMLAVASPPKDRGQPVTGVFQLLLRDGASLCSRWGSSAVRVARDTSSTLVDRSLAYRYAQSCGREDPPTLQAIRTDWEGLEESDLRAVFTKQAVACALQFGKLRPPARIWREWGSAAQQSGGVNDETGDFDVSQTLMMTVLLTDPGTVCTEGVYG
ncbi:hypothetical protein BJ993_002673 [Nocardioides aromaticivorans]|uniref:Uncharacterized protein n=1 Tax=Nocardioides aromaticivorans TaxID=200618 RepID=A0A7Y9ZJQ0_9ACTN|nr:hypothetical protein [Nocardioides aromaticivorans]NYI45593.1 hypothetical protein [Nocardioides aromaticivorans]